MKLHSIRYGKGENLDRVAVTMSIHEAAFLAKLIGNMDTPQSNDVMPRGDVLGTEIYSCLTNMFNRHWDNGVDGFLAGDDE